MKKTKPMSRCIIQVRHSINKYQLKYLSRSMDGQMIRSGMIISKQIEDRSRMINVVTAFHVGVPQLDYAFHSFILISLLPIAFVTIPASQSPWWKDTDSIPPTTTQIPQ